MGPLAITATERYTYGDYLKWDNGERWELIDGVAYDMTPAPLRIHQEISRELLLQIGNYLRDKSCKLYAAPFDVRLPEGDETDEAVTTVVQPDLVIVCDHSKLDDKGCKGSPDLIVEILSPATARKDLKEKFVRYERSGVKEYWIVDPASKTVTVFRLSFDGRYGRPDVYGEEERVKVEILGDLEVDLQPVFSKG
jgi:Uma2 family endonuclease